MAGIQGRLTLQVHISKKILFRRTKPQDKATAQYGGAADLTEFRVLSSERHLGTGWPLAWAFFSMSMLCTHSSTSFSDLGGRAGPKNESESRTSTRSRLQRRFLLQSFGHVAQEQELLGAAQAFLWKGAKDVTFSSDVKQSSPLIGPTWCCFRK